MAYWTEIEKINPNDTKRGEIEEVCIGAKSLLLSKLGGRRQSGVNKSRRCIDPSLSVIEKFNHLIKSLQDDALRSVKVFQITEANYQSAL